MKKTNKVEQLKKELREAELISRAKEEQRKIEEKNECK